MSELIENANIEEPASSNEKAPEGPSYFSKDFVISLFELNTYKPGSSWYEPAIDKPAETSNQKVDDFDNFIQSQIADVPDVKSDGISASEQNIELDR